MGRGYLCKGLLRVEIFDIKESDMHLDYDYFVPGFLTSS